MSASTFKLQEKQKAALLRMLAFNSDEISSATSDQANARWGDHWKILVYDRFCRDVISPVLKLHELRKQGVTLHMLLDSEREEIADVPAVYFVQPECDNIKRIARDCSVGLYSSLRLNFASPLPRDQLETLARLTVETNSASMITKIYDQYLNYICLEPQLFTLNNQASYSAYNDPKAHDSKIEETMKRITQGLFSVLATMGTVPVIRCPNNDGPSKMVAMQLHSTLSDHLVARNSLFSDTLANSLYQRPVLIIMDRNEDIASALHHPSTYQALVDDLLKLQMNRVKVEVIAGGEGARPTERTYDLDPTSDAFFSTHAGDLFPDAIAANEEEMKNVTKKEEEIRSRAAGGSAQDLTGSGDGAKDLAAAIDTLPMLMENKKILEMHTNIFQAAFKIVAKRHIPTYSMLEQKLIDSTHVDKAEVLDLIADPEKGTLDDKLRLMMIYYLTTSSSNFGEFEEAYISAYRAMNPTSVDPPPDLSAWRYIRKHKAFQQHASVGGALSGSVAAHPGANPSMSMFKGLAGNLAGHAQGWLQQAASSVKNFLPENKKLHITRVTDAICEVRPNTEDDTFLYLDPKIKSTMQEVPRQQTPFRDVIVFMIGGGNYNEYQNLQAYAKAQQPPRNIVYGSTEILNAEAFLEQIKTLEK